MKRNYNDKEYAQFRKEVLTAIQNPSRNQPRYMAQDPFKPFDNSGTFINLDNI